MIPTLLFLTLVAVALGALLRILTEWAEHRPGRHRDGRR